jgi:hypothetical protein
MRSKLCSSAAFVAGAAFAACLAEFGADATSASAYESAFPAVGTSAKDRLPIEFGELGQIGTFDTADKIWTVQNR